MVLKDAGPRRSAPANIMDALRMSWQASHRLFLLVVVIVPALEGLLGVGLLLLFRGGMGVFLDATGTPQQTTVSMIPWLGGAVLVTLFMLSLTNIRHTLDELLLERVRQLSARRMHRAVAMLELADFDDPVVHDRISRAEATADFKPRQVVRGVNGLLASVFQIVFFTVLLFTLEPLLLPMMLAAAAPIVLISSKLAGDRFTFFTNVTPLERRRRYVGQLMVGRRSAAELRAFGLTGHFSDRYDALVMQRYEELRQMLRGQWRKLLTGQLTFGLILCAVVAVLAWFYSRGGMDTAALLTTILTLSRLASAVGGLGGPIAELSEAALFLGDQHAFYRQLGESERARSSDRPRGALRELRVRDLSFSYLGSERQALRDIDLTIQAGQLVAFVGPNGSGKTTLAKILAFLYTPTEGAVLWNGDDAAELDVKDLRDHVTAVFQDHLTYHFSVAENVALGDVSHPPDPEAISAAVTAAGGREAVDRLPEGFDTPLGPEFGGGSSLSGGELQRLSIARAFYRGRELVIMDEPTSALDAQADHALLRDLRGLLADRTAIVISHRFSNVRDADQIFVFDEGRIVERGTHESLMAEKGLYAEMYALQASAFQATPTGTT